MSSHHQLGLPLTTENLKTVLDSRNRLAAHRYLLRSGNEDGYDTELYNAPIFTEIARNASLKSVHASNGEESPLEGPFSQFGLIAGDITKETSNLQDNRLFQNVSSPSSTFICGSQGSGKSHTLSCLLENCLIPCTATVLPRPLTALVFHYDTFVSDTGGAPCEAAYLSSHPDVSVRVLCAPTNRVQIKVSHIFAEKSPCSDHSSAYMKISPMCVSRSSGLTRPTLIPEGCST